MADFIDRWLFDPTIGKFVAAAIGLLIVITMTKFWTRWIKPAARSAWLR